MGWRVNTVARDGRASAQLPTSPPGTGHSASAVSGFPWTSLRNAVVAAAAVLAGAALPAGGTTRPGGPRS